MSTQPKGALKHGGLRVLICGGRGYGVAPNPLRDDRSGPPPSLEEIAAARERAEAERAILFRALDRVAHKHGIVCLISGCATGADTLGLEWAEQHRIPTAKYPVTRGEWRTIGKSAGILRNARMLAEGTPDLCVSFTGGRGTADMVGRCKSAGVLVYDPITNTVS